MATAAAAIMARARREVVSHFMANNAVSAANAVAFEPNRRVKRRQFERMRDAGVIHATGMDRYWLDVPRYDEWQRSRRRRAGLAVGAAALIGATIALLAG
ncbi:hypothetical protein [Sphingomonas oligophenolica]|uniref:Uncharacterized protein n=1 Tax=Sphingomonas oligophenolica TaxID=301154 RepID=A0A502CP02_9SPHN|nr:hypothetical protein [Sphingomonas oligophenolica]TPG13526.1 hypothetical protein EAH84_04820 [Sphingomonas oligophenolica]